MVDTAPKNPIAPKIEDLKDLKVAETRKLAKASHAELDQFKEKISIDKAVVAVTGLIDALRVEGAESTDTEAQIIAALKIAVGEGEGVDQQQKLEWLMGKLGIDKAKLGNTPEEAFDEEDLLPKAEKKKEATSVSLESIPEAGTSHSLILNKFLVGEEFETLAEAEAIVIKGVEAHLKENDLTGLAEAAKKAQEAGGMAKMSLLIKKFTTDTESVLGCLGLTEADLKGTDPSDLVTEVMKRVVTVFEGYKAEGEVQGLNSLKAHLRPYNREDTGQKEKLKTFYEKIPEWAQEDDLATEYETWVEKKGGKEPFDSWLKNVREVPEDEKGMFGFFNSPAMKKMLFSLFKGWGKISNIVKGIGKSKEEREALTDETKTRNLVLEGLNKQPEALDGSGGPKTEFDKKWESLGVSMDVDKKDLTPDQKKQVDEIFEAVEDHSEKENAKKALTKGLSLDDLHLMFVGDESAVGFDETFEFDEEGLVIDHSDGASDKILYEELGPNNEEYKKAMAQVRKDNE